MRDARRVRFRLRQDGATASGRVPQSRRTWQNGTNSFGGDGGGIDGTTVTVTNSTIGGNHADATNGPGGNGGGIHGITLTVTNSLAVGNTVVSTSGSGGDIKVNSYGTTKNNLYTDASPTLPNSTQVASFIFAGSLIDNGGPTPTLATDTASLAYQAGDLTTCQGLQSTGADGIYTGAAAVDQRGAPRVVSSKCSIGAFEPGSVSTKTTLSTTSAGGSFGTSVTFTAAVAGVLGSTPPDAMNAVTFKNGSTTLGTANLTSGSASFTTTALPPSNSITATYGGGTNYAASAGSNAVSVPITKATPTVMVMSNSPMNTSTVGQSVTFTATVTGVAGTTPTGTITFTSGGMTLGSGAVTLNGNGVATVTTSSLHAGRETIIATYSGDGNYLTGTAGTVAQLVEATSVPVQPAAHATVTTVGIPAVQPTRKPTATPSGSPAVQPARH